MDHPSAKEESSTCTACAGTLMLEFAALSRLTGNPEYEVSDMSVCVCVCVCVCVHVCVCVRMCRL